eukprot:3423067-Pleurochrysis_carterae.AAC.1
MDRWTTFGRAEVRTDRQTGRHAHREGNGRGVRASRVACARAHAAVAFARDASRRVGARTALGL